MAIDPICGMEVDVEGAAANVYYMGKWYYFCSVGCRDKFMKNPDKYVSKGSGILRRLFKKT